MQIDANVFEPFLALVEILIEYSLISKDIVK